MLFRSAVHGRSPGIGRSCGAGWRSAGGRRGRARRPGGRPADARPHEAIRQDIENISEIDYAPLGAARAQIHETYIISQTHDGLVIVDQHAAHERLLYENLKRQREQNGVAKQMLLIPIVVELDSVRLHAISAVITELASLGLVLEPFGPGAILVRESPAILGDIDHKKLIANIADLLAEEGVALPPITVVLEKRLPVAAGLGGGSSDAAAALRGALRLSGTTLSDARLFALAAEVGSDVPLFLPGGPVLLEGRGERITRLAPWNSRPGVLLITPRLPIRTPDVFAAFAAGARGEKIGRAHV